MKILLKLFLALVIFTGAIGYFAPASIVEKYLPSNISTNGLNGTLLNGNAQTIIIDKIGLQNTKWSAKPLSLLTGKVQADISFDSNNLAGELETTYSGSDVHNKDIDLKGDLSLLAPYFERYGLIINGNFDAKFKNLDITNGIPSKVDGILKTTNTSILGFVALNLGDVSSEFTPIDDGFQIYLNNQNGELDINGVVKMTTNGIYNADLTLSRNARTPDNVLQTVQLIGEKIDEDRVKLVHKGQLSI
ncbi:MAG: type II secretion system protein N [Gammaproteobacteria bacterium]